MTLLETLFPYAVGILIGIGMWVVYALTWVYRNKRERRQNTAGGGVYECDACGAIARSPAEAREHAETHSAIDELTWRDVMREVSG